MEDEEEVERERRRRVKSSSSTTDPDSDFSHTLGGQSDSTHGMSTSDTTQGLSSVEQIQLDFVEMLRARDEKRRMRHVETLRRQKGEEEDEGGEARVELLGDLDVEESAVASRSVINLSKPQQPTKRVTCSPRSSTSSDTSSSYTDRQFDNGESSAKDHEAKPPTNPARKFVSSVSISLDKSPSTSGCPTPTTPCSPVAPLSPRENWSSSRAAQSPIENGHTHETTANGSNFEPTAKPAFVRQSSRTISFRMMKKKEDDSSPLQRSASVRIASKKFEYNAEQNPEEDKTSSFQRNSRQRISSRSIQEKMERLAQAAQKSEMVRSPDVSQKTLSLMEEVSRKRGLFEKDQQAQSPSSSGVSRQEFRNFRSGMSERINKWINKTNQSGSSHGPSDIGHVDITSKRSLFENRADSGKI